MATTIFERTGGFSAVRKIVADFYDRLLDDAALQKYFANIDMARLIDHQTQFVSSMMGGPGEVSNDSLRKAHERLNINKADFLKLAGILRDTLEDHDLPDEAVQHIYNEVMTRETFIVSKK